MTNLEKMNQIVGSNSTKETVLQWAYMNRILLIDLPYEDEFQEMRKSGYDYLKRSVEKTEYDNFNKFLDEEFSTQ